MALAAADDPAWERAVPLPAGDRSSNAPLLDGVTVRLEARRVRQLVRELLRAAERAGSEGLEREPMVTPPRRRRLDSLAVVKAAITQDVEAIERVAAEAGVDAGRLAAVAQLAVMPFLRACATRLRDQIPETWFAGYCPICGAWPALAELRGLERNRRLRCGRCGSDWPIPVLRCLYCDELHHEKLHALLPEGNERTRRVDVCDSCKGYVKTFSTLQPMPLRVLATTDLATVELDIVAQERGYARPSRACSLSLKITRAPAAPRSPEGQR